MHIEKSSTQTVGDEICRIPYACYLVDYSSKWWWQVQRFWILKLGSPEVIWKEFSFSGWGQDCVWLELLPFKESYWFKMAKKLRPWSPTHLTEYKFKEWKIHKTILSQIAKDREAWRAAVLEVAESDMILWLNNSNKYYHIRCLVLLVGT